MFNEEFFENIACKYYPCHHIKHINCLFCYCPLYNIIDCGGTFKFISIEDKNIKDCSNCAFPHKKRNFKKVIMKLK
jgi:Zn-finger protein